MPSAVTDPKLADMRVLLLHNRYRTAGGEERYVSQLAELLGRRAAGVGAVQRDSATLGRAAAARALVKGGVEPEAVAEAVRRLDATIVHAHNIHPALGWRALAAAREAGAAVVLHLHNYRLFCATGVVFRDGRDCVECAPRRMRAGVRHNCRGSRAEALAYATGLGRWQDELIANVDLFVSPTRQLADDLRELGFDLPVDVLPTWLPDAEFADRSRCGDGAYGLMAGRVTEEKGVFVAVEAAARAGVPLKIVGDGPALNAARELAAARAAPVEFTGRLEGQAMVAARLGAAFAVLPSTWREVLPFAALEAQAGGLPLIVSDRGGLPELTDAELVFASGDATQLAERMRLMFEDLAFRESAGERALERARERFGETVYAARLGETYERALNLRAA